MAIKEIKLSKEDQKRLEELGPDVEALQREVTKAERAGIDVVDLRSKLDTASKLRDGVLREYGQ